MDHLNRYFVKKDDSWRRGRFFFFFTSSSSSLVWHPLLGIMKFSCPISVLHRLHSLSSSPPVVDTDKGKLGTTWGTPSCLLTLTNLKQCKISIHSLINLTSQRPFVDFVLPSNKRHTGLFLYFSVVNLSISSKRL